MAGKIGLLTVVFVVLTSSCQPSIIQSTETTEVVNLTIQNSFSPQPVDDDLVQGRAYVDSVQVKLLKGGSSTELVFNGSLPTPCSQLRLDFLDTTARNRIDVSAYSVTKPDEICAQMLQDFMAKVLLIGLKQGEYILFVNGAELLHFTIPTVNATLPQGVVFTEIVGNILSKPENYVGQQVIIVGYYRGWDLLDETDGQSPVTRSDWVIKDTSGAIYVSAEGEWPADFSLNPSSFDETIKVLRLTGIVRLTAAGQPYIEPVKVELIY